MRAGFTPSIGPFAHLSMIFGWVEDEECSLGGRPFFGDRTDDWGGGDLDRDDRTDPEGRCGGPGGNPRVAGGGTVGPGELPGHFGGLGLATPEGILSLNKGAGCSSRSTIAVVTLTRLGFLMRSLVGYNAAKQM